MHFNLPSINFIKQFLVILSINDINSHIFYIFVLQSSYFPINNFPRSNDTLFIHWNNHRFPFQSLNFSIHFPFSSQTPLSSKQANKRFNTSAVYFQRDKGDKNAQSVIKSDYGTLAINIPGN